MKTNTPVTMRSSAAPTVVRNMLTIGKFWRSPSRSVAMSCSCPMSMFRDSNMSKNFITTATIRSW